MKIEFSEVSQEITVRVENESTRRASIYPAVGLKLRVVDGSGLYFRRSDAAGPASGPWSPIALSSMAKGSLPLKMVRLAPGQAMEASCKASDFLVHMKKIEGFGPGVWVQFRARYYTEKNMKKHVEASTPWLRYDGDRIHAGNLPESELGGASSESQSNLAE